MTQDVVAMEVRHRRAELRSLALPGQSGSALRAAVGNRLISWGVRLAATPSAPALAACQAR